MHLEEVQEETFSRQLCRYSVLLCIPKWKKWMLFLCHIHSVFNYCCRNNHCLSSRGLITSTYSAPLYYRHIGRLTSAFTPAAFMISSAQQVSTPFRQHPFCFFSSCPCDWEKNFCDKSNEVICFIFFFQIFSHCAYNDYTAVIFSNSYIYDFA